MAQPENPTHDKAGAPLPRWYLLYRDMWDKEWERQKRPHPFGLEYPKKAGKGTKVKTAKQSHRNLYEWAKDVKKRDGYRCQVCGSSGLVHAHHIEPKGKRPDLAVELSNGVTLCGPCHASAHNNPLSGLATWNPRKKQLLFPKET